MKQFGFALRQIDSVLARGFGGWSIVSTVEKQELFAPNGSLKILNCGLWKHTLFS